MVCSCAWHSIHAQMVVPKFGKGLQVTSTDSSFYLKLGFRFQTLYTNNWNLPQNNLSQLEDYESALFIRRSRLKFDGYALTPKLKYKAELALSNRDNGGGNSSDFSNAANIILDAQIEWNFYKGFSVWVGQGKMPGNRERIVSSGNLQFVDRSRLNSRYTLDRDVGLMLKHKHKIGETFILKETIALSSGEGKNITSGNVGGSAYTFKVEAFPFGDFQSKGAYTGSAVKYEEKAKLAIAVAYDTNQDAGRERGQKGSFILDPEGNAAGKDLNSFFADFMFKHKNLSIMGEYVTRDTEDGDANVYYENGEEKETIGTYYTGSAVNLAVGYMLKNNWEIAGRWTDVNPNEGVASDETQYTLGLSKYIAGHKLKVQTDVTYRSIETSEDDLFYRIQMDFHF